MDASFAQVIAPLGCFTTCCNHASVQHESQGYIRSTTSPSVTSLERLKARVKDEGQATVALRAAAEVHVITHPLAPEVRQFRAFPQRIAALMLIEALLKEVSL